MLQISKTCADGRKDGREPELLIEVLAGLKRLANQDKKTDQDQKQVVWLEGMHVQDWW